MVCRVARILIRHTRVADGEGRCYGSLDLPLAATAEADIAAVLQRVPTVGAIVSSPAARCRRLAQALAARDGCALTIEPALRELDFGAWEGLRWDEIDRAQSDPWAEDPWHRAPPRGESEAALWQRLQHWLAATPTPPDRRTAIVAHAGPLRLLRCHFEGRDLHERWTLSLPPGGVVEIG
jgi:alpha-ribazole phosphatase